MTENPYRSPAEVPESPEEKIARPQRRFGFQQTFRTLRYRNYRLFFGGQGLSLIGTWVTRVATGWLIWKLTGSEFQLGLVTFAGQAPIPILSPLAGVWVDRFNRHRILVITQVLSMVQSLALAWLCFSGDIAVWQVIVLAVFQGIVNAVDTPTRQAFLIELVDDRRDLSNAIALNSSMFNGARLIGPALGGMFIALASQKNTYHGEALCFFVDGVSYLAVIAALLGMRLKPYVPKVHTTHIWHGLREGFVYTFHFGPIRAILTLLGTASLMGMSYAALLPAVASKQLAGGPKTYGLLMTATGIGALAGAVFLASRTTVRGLARIIVASSTTFGVALIAFAASGAIQSKVNLSMVPISFALLLLIGFGMMVQAAGGNTILQTIVDDDKRGRVMSFYTVAVLGMASVGSLLAGAIAEWIGTPLTIGIGGAACLVATATFAWQLPALRDQIRPIYQRMGIIPEVAKGLQTATRVSGSLQE